MESSWPADLPVVQVRLARATNQLSEMVRFYHEGLALPIIGSFSGHAGYSGVMLGLPGHDYHLEFTAHETLTVSRTPNADDLLVFYLPNEAAISRLTARLAALGYPSVAPINPYWLSRSVTIADPDGWRVVLVNSEGI